MTSNSRWIAFLIAAGWLFLADPGSRGQSSRDYSELAGYLKRGDGVVQFRPQTGVPEAPAVFPTRLTNGNQVRTGDRGSRAFLEWDNKTDQVLYQNSLVEVRLVPSQSDPPLSLVVRAGAVRVQHRQGPGSIPISTPTLTAVLPRGTEYVVEYDPQTQETRVVMLDGAATLQSVEGEKKVDSGFVGIARPGQPIQVVPIGTVNVVQWWVPFPAVVDPGKIGLTVEDREALKDVLAAYLQGNPKAALRSLSRDSETKGSPSEPARVFLAGLWLASGSPERAEDYLQTVTPSAPGYRALRALQTALTPRLDSELRGQVTSAGTSESDLLRSLATDDASDALAASYLHQSYHRLDEASESARLATERSPQFGYAWVRRADLEFSRGNLRRSREVAFHARTLVPDSADLYVLLGFLAAAAYRMEDAEVHFSEAIRLDPGLAHGWLGRGLARLRRGDRSGALEDLRSATAAEPSGALLHAYLGRGFGEEGDLERALAELVRAKELDERDPVPWIYAAVLDRRSNRLHSAIRNWEEAENRGGNRRVYRSESLLAQDRAVSRINQALVFQEAGLEDQGMRAARRALALEPKLDSAHRFLAESYATDPQSGLRNETARVSEYLQANLLSPVAGGTLSPTLSQQEYTALFEQARTEVFSTTEYRSSGSWVQAGGLRGLDGGTAALAEGTYRWVPGEFPNADFEESSATLQAKLQLSLQDELFFQTAWSTVDGGDFGFANEAIDVDPDVRVCERLEPLALLGWHRAWSAEHSTLVLASGVRGLQQLDDPTANTWLLTVSNSTGTSTWTDFPTERAYASDLGLGGMELQHLARIEKHAVVGGVLFQSGTVATEDWLGGSPVVLQRFLPPRTTELSGDFGRWQIYAYDTWQLTSVLQVTAGLSYDAIRYPANHRYAPLSDNEETRSQWSPKLGALWQIQSNLWCRAAYAQALGGFSYDQSLRIEPTQVAGFNQAYRSLIPEAVAGPSSAPFVEVAGLALEGKAGKATWWGMTLERLYSEVGREVGLWIEDAESVKPLTPGNTHEDLCYLEHTLRLNLQHLLHDRFAFGVGYLLDHVDYQDRFPVLEQTQADERVALHQLSATVTFNDPSGFFARGKAAWLSQESSSSASSDRDSGWQIDLFAGWRLAQRRVEVLVGVLNVGDEDFPLSPLAVRNPLPRERTFFTRLQWRF